MAMCGIVNARLEPTIRLLLRGPAGSEVVIDAIVDTGFTGFIALPTSVIKALGLARRSGGHAVLADGSTADFDVFDVEAIWDGSWLDIKASAMGDDPLIGMELIKGHELKVEAVPGGLVSVGPLAWADED